VDRDRCDLPVKIAIAILVLVTAAALAAVAVGVAGWLAGRVGPGRASSQNHTAIAARPWPSVETPTVHADRPNCAH